MGKPTAESNEGWGGQSSRAVDGNTNGNWLGGSCTHTTNSPNNYWTVDLLWKYAIDKVVRFRSARRLLAAPPAYCMPWQVVVYPRVDCCVDQLNNVVRRPYAKPGWCVQAGLLCRMSAWTVSCAAQSAPQLW